MVNVMNAKYYDINIEVNAMNEKYSYMSASCSKLMLMCYYAPSRWSPSW